MTKLIKLLFLSLLFFSSCYTDDSSQPNLPRLPFEDFTEFFADNNAQVDTLVFGAGQEAILNTLGGKRLIIPENAFTENGEVSLEIKETTSKSDFLFLNKPTIDGDALVECTNAISIRPFTNNGSLNIENPIEIKMSLPDALSSEDLDYFYFENGWNKDNSIDITEANNQLTFETSKSSAWQVGAKAFDNNSTVDLTINPAGYGSIPHDMRAFVILVGHNVVFPLDYNVTEVTSNGSIPKGMDAHIVVMVMDHFQLSVGVETMNLDENANLDFQMSPMTVDEMIDTIRGLN